VLDFVEAGWAKTGKIGICCRTRVDVDTPYIRQGKRYFMLSTPEGFAQNTPEFGRYNATCNSQKAGYFSEYRADLTRQAYEQTVAFLRH
jgi:hypothetical protein